MSKPSVKAKLFKPRRLAKSPTGITGFDQITDGGLPKNNITLIGAVKANGPPGRGAVDWRDEPSIEIQI